MKFGSWAERKNKDINPIVLIQFSGGIDSTYVLYKWLKENPKDYCLVHHINLINHEGRKEVEQTAVYRILNWLDKNGLNNYLYLENTFDYGNLNYIISDVEVCGFHAGVILRNPRWEKITKVIMPIYNNETKREGIRRELIKMVSYKDDIELLYPITDLKKLDVINLLPQQLLDMCWYCRTPINNMPCGNCHTCKEVNLKK